MKFHVEFQLKPAGRSQPLGHNDNDDEIVYGDGQLGFLPDVGDSVTYASGGKPVARKVLSRHFIHSAETCCVNLVVSDLPAEEFAARISEWPRQVP